MWSKVEDEFRFLLNNPVDIAENPTSFVAARDSEKVAPKERIRAQKKA
jgi:hypothetical protein